MGSLYQTESFLTACISLVRSQTNPDGANSRRVRNHEKKSGDAVHRLGTILQSIFCAQSRASIRLAVWKWSGESLCLKPFVAPFLPTRLTAPGSPRMSSPRMMEQTLFLAPLRMRF